MNRDRLLLLGVSSFLLACGGTTEPGGPDLGGAEQVTCGGQPATLVQGAITKDARFTADKRWLLRGRVDVTNKATLTIEPGTTVCGDSAQALMNVSFLNIDQDAKLIADGTVDKPIVFTSSNPVGMRKPQDWGGVVLRGRAPVNNPPDQGKPVESVCPTSEINAGVYGPCGTPRSDDNSGVLRYVRIEFAGREFSQDKELNGLSLYAVGSGTTLDYIQVHQPSDDGIEFFGGTANLKHALISSGQDDGIDWEFGWVGKGQFWLIQQDVPLGNNGFEMDNNRVNALLLPRSKPTVYNVTLLGLGRATTAGGADKRQGLACRSAVGGKLANLIVSGFSDVGVFLEEPTVPVAKSGELAIVGSYFWQNGKEDKDNVSSVVKVGATDFDVKGWVLGQMGNKEADPQLEAPFNREQPSFKLKATSPALTGAQPVPANDPFFESVTYSGGMGASDWTAGWTAYPKS